MSNKAAAPDEGVKEEHSPQDASPTDRQDDNNHSLDATKQLSDIRDLLFGEQSRAMDQRTDHLESSLTKQIEALGGELRKSLETLRTDTFTQLNHLASHVEELNQQHQSKEQKIESELSETSKNLNKADLEIEAHLEAEVKKMMNELTAKYNDMMARLAETSDDLKNNKADRKTLATLLASMANNLTVDE